MPNTLTLLVSDHILWLSLLGAGNESSLDSDLLIQMPLDYLAKLVSHLKGNQAQPL